MTLNLLWIRFVAFGLLVASFSSPCWGQEQKSPTATASPTSQHIGLIDQVAALQREVETLKQKIASLELTDEITVPLGTMLPFFAATLPKGDRWIWADGKSQWPNEAWVPKNLQGKPVPDLTKGLLVGGSTPDVSVGNVWNKGVIGMPELTVSGNAFQVASVASVKPLGPGSEQSSISSKFPILSSTTCWKTLGPYRGISQSRRHRFRLRSLPSQRPLGLVHGHSADYIRTKSQRQINSSQ